MVASHARTGPADLDGRSAVVLGASGALGDALVAALVGAGARVTGLDRAEPAADRRRAGVDYRVVDVLDDASVAAAFDGIDEPWAFLNVVGGFAGHAPLTELDSGVLVEQLRLNLTSAALITKHALRRLGAAGAGRIVHTGSRAAVQTEGSGFAYSVSKLGVLHLVEMAALETNGTGITVNAVVPNVLDTPANRAAMPGAAYERWPTTADVAAVYLFLASPAAHLISGAAVPVYGLV